MHAGSTQTGIGNTGVGASNVAVQPVIASSAATAGAAHGHVHTHVPVHHGNASGSSFVDPEIKHSTFTSQNKQLKTHFTKLGRIGEGAYGVVFKAVSNEQRLIPFSTCVLVATSIAMQCKPPHCLW
jgi:hypothetical protein